MTDENAAPDSSAAFDALLQEAARQSSGQPLLVAGKKLNSGRFEIRRRIGKAGWAWCTRPSTPLGKSAWR